MKFDEFDFSKFLFAKNDFSEYVMVKKENIYDETNTSDASTI